MRATNLVLVALLALGAPLAAAAEAVSVEYLGIATTLDGRVELYRERHRVERDRDGRGTRVVVYECPDGRPYARKVVRYADWAGAPDFDLLDARDGWRERVETVGDRRRVSVRERAGGRERSAELSVPDQLVVDAGFDDFVRLHWDRLVAGERVDFAFLVPSRLEVMRFRVRRQGETTIDGEPALVIRLGLGAWYAFMLPHIDVTYLEAGRRLARFEGLTNQRTPGGGHVSARIDFPSAERRSVAAGALDAVLAAPLDGDCRF
jgi:hypothetical protein